MEDGFEHVRQVLWGGFIIGLVFGAVGQRLEFCLSGGLTEWWREGKPRRAAAFLLALAVAVAGTQALMHLGLVDLGDSIYLRRGFSWLLVPLGGVLFGYGMILARGCGSRALVLLTDGNVRSLVVLLSLGISAAAALTGLLANRRLVLTEATTLAPDLPSPTLPGVLESWGVGGTVAVVVPGVLIVAALAGVALFRMDLRRYPWQAAGAVIIGCLPVAGWWVTGHLGADDFDPVRLESLTFVAPVGDSIQYLMLSTALQAGFGVTVVGGVLLGSLGLSTATRSFELRGFRNAAEVLHAAGGGVLMGLGGALALGCSIGQGLTGAATLALSSFLALAGILAGAWIALIGPLRVREQ